MPSIGSLFASLTLQSASFMSGIRGAQKEMRETQRLFASAGAGLAKAGAVMTAGLTAPFAALVAEAMPAATESRQALAQVQATLASMGPAAGRTSEQLQAAAGRLQDLSNFDDDDILKSVTANLLTFGKIAGPAFDRAQLAAVNLSARLGTDLQSAALLVGKALNDPVKGLTALSRTGIQFTNDQKAMIKEMVASGNAAGAQGVILGELERQFGGAAKAQRDATPGAASQQAWRTFQETIGEIGLKVMPPLLEALTTILTKFNAMPGGMQVATIGVAAFAAVIGPVAIGLGGIVTGIGALVPVFAALSTFVTATAVPAIVSFGAVLLPMLAPLAAVAGAVALVVAAVRHWDEIKAVALRVLGYMSGLYQGVKTWLKDKLAEVFGWVVGKVKAVGDAFFTMYDRVVGHSYVPDMVDEIGKHMARLAGNMVEPTRRATAAVAGSFKALADELRPVLDELFPDAAAANRLERSLATIERAQKAGVKRGGLSVEQAAEARRRAMTGARGPNDLDAPIDAPLLSDLDEISGGVKTLDDVLKKFGLTSKAATDTTKRGFSEAADAATSALDRIVGAFRSGGLLDKFEAIVGFGLQLGKAGAFGKSVQARFQVEGARAAGGPVTGGRPYLVGERGPEIVVPSTSGTVIPNHGLRAASGNRPMLFDLRGAVMTDDLLAQVNLKARQTAGGIVMADGERRSFAASRRL